MWQFKKCICESDFNTLIVSGHPTPEQIAEAWINLFYEYCDLAEDAEVRMRTKLMAEIELLESKYDVASDWISIIEIRPSEKISQALRVIDLDFEFNPDEPIQYKADIHRAKAELIYLKIVLKIKKAEFKANLEKVSTQDSVNEKYFATIYFNINNYSKREAVNDMSFVSEYCAALRSFSSYVDHYNKLMQDAGIR